MQGTILFNGNVENEADFITRFRERVVSSNHRDPAVRASKKVLMVTAAWKKDEYNEGHVRAALNRIGIASKYDGGYDANIQNLAVYHDFTTLRAQEPELYRQYHAKQEVIKEVKHFYRRKNSDLVSLLKDQNQLLKKSFPDSTLANVLAYPVSAMRRDLLGLSPKQLQYHFCCQDLQETMKSIVANDAKMVDVCNEIDLYFVASSGVTQNASYVAIRRKLEERILSANSIFLFGGHVAVLYNRLNFFKLKSAFEEALRRGTNFYAVSAGTGVLCNSIILYDDYAEDRRLIRDFEFFDNGFGIVTAIQIFPHCMDRIKTDDPDNLAYLAHRFPSGTCLGMNQESYLLREMVPDAAGQMRERYTSVGDKDGVYCFDKRGQKAVKRKGETLDLLP